MSDFIELHHNIVIKKTNINNKHSISTEQLSKKSLFSLKKFLKKEKKLIFDINIAQIDNISNLASKIVSLYHYCIEKSIEIGNSDENNHILAYIYANPCAEEDTKIFAQLKELFGVLSLNERRVEYSYIYDKACEELDTIFSQNNFCNFQNDSCVKQRNCKTKNITMGCCYSFYYRKFDKMPISTGRCKYLSVKGCTIKCLCCKMFTCKYLRKQGVKFTCEDFFLLNAFLSKKQKDYTTTLSFFTPKEEIIEHWLKYKVC